MIDSAGRSDTERSPAPKQWQHRGVPPVSTGIADQASGESPDR